MANDPGWQPDPERVDQERYWDGAGWTDQVRPGAGPADDVVVHVPEHGHELHRALAAATDDIDAVEARLSTMFERTGGTRGAGSTRATSRDADDADGPFAELDAALVAEAADDPDDRGEDRPESKSKSKRSIFRRRSQGVPSARS